MDKSFIGGTPDPTTGQLRARKGGEFGANGDWYEGGKFIATQEDAKSSPVRWEPSPEQVAADARRAEQIAKFEAWLVSRRLVLADAIAALEAHGNPDDIYENFYASMGRQLRESGSLTRRQAVCAVKGVFGRRTKKNEEAYEDMIDLMAVEYSA